MLQAITALLPDLACRLDSGLVGTISVQLPWPNLMTGDLMITISDLSLNVVVDGSARTERESSSLTDSLVSAAEDILHRDSEGIELEESIHASIIEEADSADPADVPNTSYIAIIVEGLLARLKVSVNNLCIGLRLDAASLPELRLRVAKIQASTTPTGPGKQVQELIRTASFEGVALYLCRTSDIRDERGADSSDEMDDAGSESDYMAMSQAIPDLRSSRLTADSFHSSASGTESIYASALMGDDGGASRVTPTPLAEGRTEEIIIKVEDEPSLVRFTVTRQSTADEDTSGYNSDEDDDDQKAQQSMKSASISLALSIEVGNIVGYFDAGSTCSLLRFSEDCIALLRMRQTPLKATKARLGGMQPSLATSVAVKGLDMVCAYESLTSMGATNYEAYMQSLHQYWLRPSKVQPEIGHLRLRMQAIRCQLLSSGLESVAELQVGDASLYEHLSRSLTDANPTIATTLPLIIFDYNLSEQYTSVKSQTAGQRMSCQPEVKVEEISIDAIDWRIPSGSQEASSNAKAGPYWRAAFGDRGWKLRPKHRRTSSTASRLAHTAPVFSGKLDSQSNIQASLAPVHLFVDFSTFDRILWLLKSLGESARADLGASEQTNMTTSFETLHQASIGSLEETRRPLIGFECDLIRVEVRVPSSAPQPHLRGQVWRRKRLLGLQVRAGTVLVDACSVRLRIGSDEASSPKARVHFDVLGGPQRVPVNWHAAPDSATLGSVDQVTFFYKPVDEQRATSFAVLGMLSSNEGTEKPLPPRVKVLKEEERSSKTPRSFVDCRLPCLNVRMSKELLDGLELMVDDFGLWSSKLGKDQEDADASSDSATDALKILGSRFFGTKHSVSALSASSASMDLMRKSESTPVFSLGVNEIYVSLIIPQRQSVKQTRHLSLAASELRLFVDTKHGPHSTLVDVTVLSLSLEDETDPNQHRTILARTLEPSLSRGVVPMVMTQLESTVDPETACRESKCEVLLQGVTVTFHGDTSLLDDLLVFSRSPDGAFEHVEPNEVTRLSLRIRDVSLCVSPVSCEARGVVLIGDLALRTKLIPDAHQTTIRGSLRDSLVLLTEKSDDKVGEGQSRARTSQEYWSNHTFAKVAVLSDVVGSVRLNSLTRPEVDVKVTKVVVEILACADTMHVLSNLASHVTTSSNVDKEVREKVPERAEDGARDLMASLDQDAFLGARPVASKPDFLDDDVPRHPDFLKGDAPWTDERDAAELSLEEELLMDDDDTTASVVTSPADIVLQSDAVTVRLLDGNGIAPKASYFTGMQASSAATPTGLSSSLRVRVHGCDVTVRLFAGYDCQTTRSAVEEEVRRVRRRLHKIKQMLDQGQTPDDSVEEATASLLDSVHIPLPDGAMAGDMEAGAMMQAMDDELGDQSETASSASTWKQFIPGRPEPQLSSQQKRKRSKLMRSKASMIDVELRGISLEYDQYALNDPLASRLLFQSKSMQILDNIKTSTWHTFLTEMAPAHSYLRRNAKDMVKVELVQVRPSQSGEVETRCRARLLPIRLHVDQDALDFLKKFSAFRPPNAVVEAPKRASNEPFIQHAEIFPIQIKLDYKPKRVDYNLLREGKTIELMNFFNFEGSEMTLRHITIRGINGWTRFFDTLQDMWTPDVKSNQLADVLSGISPIRSLVNVGNGMADLILLPIEQYQRDGRLAKGLKAGAKSFAKSTMLEAARIGARLATGTQVILEQAETVLGGRRLDENDDGVQEESDDEAGSTARISRYAHQPDTLMQALSEAQQGLSRGFSEAAQTILAVPMEVYERRAGEGGSRPVVRAVPIAVLKGTASASGAVGKTLQGIQRELAGASLEEEEDKYKKARGR